MELKDETRSKTVESEKKKSEMKKGNESSNSDENKGIISRKYHELQMKARNG